MGWVASPESKFWWGSKTYKVTSHIIYNSLRQKGLFATKDDLNKGRPLMTTVGRVVRWLRRRPVWAGNRYDSGYSWRAADPVPADQPSKR